MIETTVKPWWRRPLPIGIAVVMVVTFLPWAYALSGLAHKTAPDTLRDKAYAATAEPLCRAAVDDIATLPPARTSKTPAARSVTLDQATDRLSLLVSELATIPVTSDFDQVIVGPWLADWERYINDRRAYANTLRAQGDTRFVLSSRGGVDYTKLMDAMAEVNRMPACKIPGDV